MGGGSRAAGGGKRVAAGAIFSSFSKSQVFASQCMRGGNRHLLSLDDTHLSLTQETAWVPELLVQSGVDASGDAVVLAALINLLPNRYTPAGRLTDDFVDSVS